MKYYVYIIIGVVLVAVVAGFFVVGSPREGRLQRFDERRVSDLQQLQSEILRYWQSKSRLPANLVDLKDDIAGFAPPVDPQTGVSYTYTIKGETSFSLCATFAKPSINAIQTNQRAVPKAPYPVGYGDAGQTFEHGAGYTCFDRTIDKDLYPPLQKNK